jgi:hypothetical protein
VSGLLRSRAERRLADKPARPTAAAEEPAQPSERTFQRVDFSRAAISRAVLKETLQKPYVLYPAVVGVLGGLAALLLGPSWLFVGLGLAGGAFGAGSWLLDYGLRRDTHAGRYLQRLHETLAGKREASMAELEQDLAEAGSEEGLSQLQRFQNKFEALQELLSKKLAPTELTYSRYLGMAEQVFLAGLDNLVRVADTLKGAAAIDEGYVGRRMAKLEGLASPSVSQQQELDTLRARLALKAEQQRKAQAWLTQNEQAMTQMDLTLAAIADLSTSEGHASTDMETAMAELQRLAQRTGRYSRGSGALPIRPK